MKNYNEFLNDANPRIELVIKDMGKMELELMPECAPITVENFLTLVEKKFYDGITFHRVIKDFMIQGGDPTATGMGGSDQKIKGEFRSNGVKNDLSHNRGVISMARTSMPNSASSQFFICHKDALFLDGSYAAFGVVVKEIEVVDMVATTKTDSSDKPINDVVIETIRRIR
ncbi:MAG: peptidylprolyl isomerase [Anaeroplasmataceae bacterium]